MKTKKEVSKKPIAKKKNATKVVAKSKVTPVKKMAVKKTVAKKVSTTSLRKKPASKSKTISASKKSVHVVKRRSNGLPSFKRMTYMTFSIILGILLATFLHLFVELVYMRNVMVSELRTNYFMGMPSFLPMAVQPLFLIAGVAFGTWLGFWGWRFVYIEKRHRTTRNA